MPTFAELCEEQGLEHRIGGTHPSVSVGWVGINCPFCGEEDGFHMGYKDGFVCWKCGPHRSGDTLAAALHIPMRAAIELANSITPEDPEDQDETQQAARKRKLVNPEGVGPLLKMHADYLRSRRLNPRELVNLWEIQGIGNGHGFYSRRVYIPVMYRGQTVSWVTRAIDAHVERRYCAAGKDAEKLPHKQLLFGEDFAGSRIAVHEGPMDVFAIGPGATATLGTGVSIQQVRRIAKRPVRFICFDSSQQAQERAKALVDQLRIYPGKTFRVELDAKDACEADERERRRFRRMLRA